MKRVLLLDLNYHLRRSVHVKALAELRDSAGRKTGGVFGLLNTIRLCLDRANPCQKVIGVWDGGLSQRRTALFPPDKAAKTGYKGHRGITPGMTPEEVAEAEELYRTLDVARELATPILLEAGVHVMKWPEREADDVIALLAREFESRNVAEQIIIASDDWDFAQCVTERVVQYRAMREEWISLHNFMERLGVPVDWAVFKKAIEGDSSDNIPGVDGCGPKTIKVALREYLVGIGCDAAHYDAHQYRNTCEAHLNAFIEWCGKHRLKKPQIIGRGRGVIMRNMQLVDLRLEQFPQQHIEHLVDSVMQPRQFNEMVVVRKFGELNINTLLENFASWSDPFRRIS